MLKIYLKRKENHINSKYILVIIKLEINLHMNHVFDVSFDYED